MTYTDRMTDPGTGLAPAGPGRDLTPLLVQARDYTEQAKAPNTRRAYAADWAHFSAWCAREGLPSLPAPPEGVALYLTALAATVKVSTLTRRLSALSQAHQCAGYASPTQDVRVRTVMAGIRRAKGTAQVGKRPVLTEDLRRMIAALPDTLWGKRDRALLLGFAGAFRRSELVALDAEDLDFGHEGVTVLVRRSK